MFSFVSSPLKICIYSVIASHILRNTWLSVVDLENIKTIQTFTSKWNITLVYNLLLGATVLPDIRGGTISSKLDLGCHAQKKIFIETEKPFLNADHFI